MIRHRVSEEKHTPYRIHDHNLDASVLSNTAAPPDNSDTFLHLLTPTSRKKEFFLSTEIYNNSKFMLFV